MNRFWDYVWVGFGSALGGMTRHWLSGVLAARFGERFPLGTLAVNVTGSFLIGVLAGLALPEGRWLLDRSWRLFLMMGVLGGYTTFSSFSIQTLGLAREGEWLFAIANVIGSLALCLGAVWAGHWLGQTLSR